MGDSSLNLAQTHRTIALAASSAPPPTIKCVALTAELEDRSQCVFYNGERSETVVIHYGVPQGSVLEPLYFLLYTVDLFNIVTSHELEVHGYADDLQIGGHSDTGQTGQLISTFSNCVGSQELDGFKPFAFESR